MNRIICILMVMLMVVCAASGCAQQITETEEVIDPAEILPVVKIGVYEPASGENSGGGKQEILGMMYAHAVCPTVEIGGVPHLVELVIVDNESSTEKGAVVAENLAQSGVSAVLGSFGSNESLAGSDAFEAADIPVVGTSCTNPEITLHNNHYFRICFLDSFQGEVLAHYAAEGLGAKKVYCLAKLGDNYSGGLCQYFINALHGLDGEVVYETYPEGCVDFAPYLNAAVEAGADVFFAPVSPQIGSIIILQAEQMGLNMPILAGDTWDSNIIANTASGTGVDIHISTHFDAADEGEAAQQFVAGFQEWMNLTPSHVESNGGDDMVSAFSALGYDAYMTAIAAMEKAGSTEPAAIMDAMWDVSYSGVTGEITFDPEHGDAVRTEAYIKKVDADNGTWQPVGKQSAAQN